MRLRHHGFWMRLALGTSASVSGCFYHPMGSPDPASTSTTDSSGPDAPTTTSDATTTTESTLSGTGTGTGATSTGPAACGDGNVDPGEQCDDGNKTPGDGCENDCKDTEPTCGDGNIDPDEECDDANAIDTDACINCKMAACGDGVLHDGVEMCDEGPDNGMYEHCATDCQGIGERCGDGVVNGPEPCDDGNDVDVDDCSNECVAPRLIFVTSATFVGDLGGLANADNLCKFAAGPLQKPTWRAWLSDDTTAAADRLDKTFTGYYKRPDGAVIAKGWSDLTDGTLESPISITEQNGMVTFPPRVWTNTGGPGMISGADHCENWTSLAVMGHYGLADATDATWTDAGVEDCTNAYHLYCVEYY